MNNEHEFTEYDLELVKSCKPGEVCWQWGEKFMKTTKARLEAAFESAFRAAWAAAEENGKGHLGEVESFDMDEPAMGATFLRVVLKDSMGRESMGIGMIPNPNTEH